MKIAVIEGAFSVGHRLLDFANIWDDERALTGTDLSLCMISKELNKLGHEIHIFTAHKHSNYPKIWENIYLHSVNDRNEVDNSFDAVISLNEPDIFRGMNNKPLKICYQFLNDFSYCGENYDSYVDQWITVCPMLKDYLLQQAPHLNKDKWKVVPLGCDPNLYQDQRVPGRVIYTSSADRGLHNLLEEWMTIKKAVPNAHLKIFYYPFGDPKYIKVNPNESPIRQEMCNRIIYINEAIEQLKDYGVEYVGSASVNQLVKELNEASVFAFSCDTVKQTEGFSLSSLQAHASYTFPVMTDQDCLGSIYENSGAIIIKSPVRERLSEFSAAVIKGLTDKNFADETIKKCREFAWRHTWENTAKQLEQIILESK